MFHVTNYDIICQKLQGAFPTLADKRALFKHLEKSGLSIMDEMQLRLISKDSTDANFSFGLNPLGGAVSLIYTAQDRAGMTGRLICSLSKEIINSATCFKLQRAFPTIDDKRALFKHLEESGLSITDEMQLRLNNPTSTDASLSFGLNPLTGGVSLIYETIDRVGLKAQLICGLSEAIINNAEVIGRAIEIENTSHRSRPG